MKDWRDEIVTFWFALDAQQWWNGDADVDASVRNRFEQAWSDLRSMPPDHFLADPRMALAAVILFDQFPRNMFRGHADQFATDPLALAIARNAVERGFDAQLPPEQRQFLSLPFEHSESLEEQDRSLALFSALGDSRQRDFAQKHRDMIARFGRFPHRNAMLGRTPRPDEVAAGKVVPW